jgi:transcriptional regulator with XRE-family HTH domain
MTVKDGVMDFYEMSDFAVVEELGRRIQRHRLNRNMTQAALARKSGMARYSVSQMENGGNFSCLSLVRVLRSLDCLGSLDAFLPEPGLSPLQLARMRGKTRMRASGKHSGEA